MIEEGRATCYELYRYSSHWRVEMFTHPYVLHTLLFCPQLQVSDPFLLSFHSLRPATEARRNCSRRLRVAGKQ